MKKELLIKSIYENCKITEPILIELIDSSVMQRLKKLTMSGVNNFAIPDWPKFTRFEHSIGVLILLRKYGANLQEQIAGLLHDASHTAFSHVGDLFFQDEEYQDNIHEWYLKKQNIAQILDKYHMSLHEILHKSGHHKVLEQDLPDICADRLDYNLTQAKKHDLITKDVLHEILDNLKFENENWFFTHIETSVKFAKLPLYLTKNTWAAAWNILLYKWLSEALKIAFKKNIITLNDMNFSTDDLVWQKLKNSKNDVILNYLNKIQNYKKQFEVTPNAKTYCDQIIFGKFRGIDPFIKQDNKLVRLTSLDKEFAKEYNKTKELIQKGWCIKNLKPNL